MGKPCCEVVLATTLALLLGCGASDSSRGPEPSGGKAVGGVSGSETLPPELQAIAELVYIHEGVLYLDNREPPWRPTQLKQVAGLTKPYPKVALGHRFEAAGLSNLRGVPNLHSLTIWELSGSTDEGLKSLGTLGRLEELTITDPVLAKAALPHIGDLTKLKKLRLHGNAEFSDTDLAPLAKLADLESLCIFDANITDNGLTHLSSLSRLRRLYFFNSRVTYPGLLQLRHLKEIEEAVTTPSWLLAEELDAMRAAWPDFRGNALGGRDTSYLWEVQGKKLAAVSPSRSPRHSPSRFRRRETWPSRMTPTTAFTSTISRTD